MTVTDKDIIAFIDQMTSEQKQEAIGAIEAIRGKAIPAYKEQRISAAEALLADVKQNPDNYNPCMLNTKLEELLGCFEASNDLKKRISVIRRFISYRNSTLYHTDGSIEKRNNTSYDEFMGIKKL